MFHNINFPHKHTVWKIYYLMFVRALNAIFLCVYIFYYCKSWKNRKKLNIEIKAYLFIFLLVSWKKRRIHKEAFKMVLFCWVFFLMRMKALKCWKDFLSSFKYRIDKFGKDSMKGILLFFFDLWLSHRWRASYIWIEKVPFFSCLYPMIDELGCFSVFSF